MTKVSTRGRRLCVVVLPSPTGAPLTRRRQEQAMARRRVTPAEPHGKPPEPPHGPVTPSRGVPSTGRAQIARPSTPEPERDIRRYRAGRRRCQRGLTVVRLGCVDLRSTPAAMWAQIRLEPAAGPRSPLLVAHDLRPDGGEVDDRQNPSETHK
jgi:hypothetical protein